LLGRDQPVAGVNRDARGRWIKLLRLKVGRHVAKVSSWCGPNEGLYEINSIVPLLGHPIKRLGDGIDLIIIF
jgi:hypothetical protein